MDTSSGDRNAQLDRRLITLGCIVVALIGVAARVYPSASFIKIGFDERLYASYVAELTHDGLTHYPQYAAKYIEQQQALPGAILPPTRFLYIFCAAAWRNMTGASPLDALHGVSYLFSILLLFVSGIFAWRLGGARIALGVFALMSCAPTQIHMAQHALIDGFFAFWATLCLWFLWENLRRPNDWRWLTGYVTALALLVLTKENAAFVYVGLLAIIGLNRWLGFGTITPRLLLSTIVGPLVGVLILVLLCGGFAQLIHIYQLLVAKASVLPYAIKTGDGPWYRYLVDLLLMSPLILLLAWGALLRLRLADKPAIFLALFVVATHAIMCNIRYGMNLRYTNMWDMPLRYLSVLCLTDLAQPVRRYRESIVVLAVAFLCLLDLRQYHIFFVEHDLYELVTGALLNAVNILK